MTGETRTLAEWVVATRPDDLPARVREEAARSFVNYIGGALGGARHDAVERTFRTVAPLSGGAQASVIGRRETLGILDAALVNCQASAANAYDDTHLATVVHPAGPVLAPLLAEAERRTVDGPALLAAHAIGVEASCRAAAALTVPPADAYVGWYMTSVAGPIGAAAGVARLLGLDVERTVHALGLAASQAAGFRQTHGSMCTSLSPATSSRAGYLAALLAAEGVTASQTTLEGPRGFAEAFAPKPALQHLADGLGQRWEMLENMAKPYPCGIVIHPLIDACLEIAAKPAFDASAITAIRVDANPLCLVLTDRPAPDGGQLAQVSLQHWVAATLGRGAAGVAEGTDAAVAAPDVLRLRALIEVRPDAAIGRDGGRIAVDLAGGQTFDAFVPHARGSLDRPMTDAELDAKFVGQAALSVSEDQAEMLLPICRRIAALDDVRDVIRRCRPA